MYWSESLSIHAEKCTAPNPNPHIALMPASMQCCDIVPRSAVSVCRYYSKMTMEVILATALGQSLEVQDGKGGKVYESATRTFAEYETDQPGLSGNLIAMSRHAIKCCVERRE